MKRFLAAVLMMSLMIVPAFAIVTGGAGYLNVDTVSGNQAVTGTLTVNGTGISTIAGKLLLNNATLALEIAGPTKLGALIYTWPLTATGATFLKNDGTGTLSWVSQAAIANPSGTDKAIQFNDGGTNFGGGTDLTWDKTTKDLKVAGQLYLPTPAANPATTANRLYVDTTGLLKFGSSTLNTSPSIPSVPALGKILRSNGMVWAASTATYPDTVAIGTILAASAANTVTAVGPGAAGTVLHGSGALAPTFAQVSLASGGDVTGTLPVANGGTGLATLNSGGVMYANSASTLVTTALGTNGQVLSSNGTIPVWTTANWLSPSLTSGNIFIGDASNVAQAKAVTGVITLSNTGLTAFSAGAKPPLAVAADTATKLATARTISVSGKATAAGVAFDGTGNIALNVTAVTADGAPLLDTDNTLTGTNTFNGPTVIAGKRIESLASQTITNGVNLTVTLTNAPAIKILNSAAATATVQTITAGTAGQVVRLVGMSDTNMVKFLCNTVAPANIQLQSGADFTLGAGDMLNLVYVDGLNRWVEISRADN